MNIVDVKISRYPNLIRGVVVEEGEQWVVLKENVVDYVLDGFLFINKRFVKRMDEIPHDSLEYKIISMKNPQMSFACLDNYVSVMEYLKSRKLLIGIGLEKQSFVLVGYIGDIFEKRIVFHPIGADLKDLPQITIDYRTIRYVSIKSDYLLSITKYLDYQAAISLKDLDSTIND